MVLIVQNIFLWILVMHFEMSELCFKAKAPQINFCGAFVYLRNQFNFSLQHRLLLQE